jgi:hypothetical protein
VITPVEFVSHAVLSGADTPDILAGESCRWPQQVLTRPWRQVQVGAIDGLRETRQVLEAAAGPAGGQVGVSDLVDVRHWDQVQVGVTAAPCAKLTSPRSVLGDDYHPEGAANQRPHMLYRLPDQRQFGGCGIRRRVDVTKRHEQAVSGSKAADRGQ